MKNLKQINPVRQKHRNEQMSYEKMAEFSGLNINTIYTVKKAEPKDILKLSVKTAMIFNEKLDINLLRYYWESK